MLKKEFSVKLILVGFNTVGGPEAPYVNPFNINPEPATFSTTTLTVPEPEGTVTLIVEPSLFADKDCGPNLTVTVLSKLAPVMTAAVPVGPVFGVIDDTVGATKSLAYKLLNDVYLESPV